MNVSEYIEKNHDGSPMKFARAVGVSRQTVNFWLKKGYIVLDNMIYSPRKMPPDSIIVDGKVYAPQRQIKANINEAD